MVCKIPRYQWEASANNHHCERRWSKIAESELDNSKMVAESAKGGYKAKSELGNLDSAPNKQNVQDLE